MLTGVIEQRLLGLPALLLAIHRHRHDLPGVALRVRVLVVDLLRLGALSSVVLGRVDLALLVLGSELFSLAIHLKNGKR
uniref:Secreted protein n=1 Tax=Steinernema glaseri TaxID=37863 RepID=A0A1I7XXH6_9BILA